ncbi:hypothetical protein SEA_HUBBS_105 [Microbacterium phage Hubbs]|nr:hypothetical protein SEA_HUBBS_105 [Microbacterium phage Hubbs]
MPATPKKIAFDDIREGDTIRVVDVRDVKITAASAGNSVYAGSLELLRENWSTETKRTFQLIDREHTPLPTKRGSVIEVGIDRYALVYDMFAPTDLWISTATGSKLTPESLQRKADLENGFEVIA